MGYGKIYETTYFGEVKENGYDLVGSLKMNHTPIILESRQ